MNASTLAPSTLTPATPEGASSWLKRHPLVGYFVLTFALSWLVWLPVVLAQNGLGLLPIKLPFELFAVLATFGGPTVAAIVMAGVTEGRAGVRALLRRYIQGKIGIGWYALILLGMPLAFLLASTVVLGAAPWHTLAAKAPLFISAYPLLLIISLFTGPLGEEPGWRGFALPRLQARLGPVGGSLVLGELWAAWHAPLFLLPEWHGTGPLGPFVLAFFGWVAPFTIIMTWVYNRTRGNLVAAILVHDALNATVGLVTLHALLVPPDLFLQSRMWWPVALLLIVVTRGRLGLKQAGASQ